MNKDVYPLCDKCGQPVDPSNDATFLDSFYFNCPEMVLLYGARHLLPVEGCEGSPSRAQYLLGVPPDSRGTWPLDPKKVAGMRAAFDKMQGIGRDP